MLLLLAALLLGFLAYRIIRSGFSGLNRLDAVVIVLLVVIALWSLEFSVKFSFG